jgi:ribosomal-protein-alanine N-acetyltransferase
MWSRVISQRLRHGSGFGRIPCWIVTLSSHSIKLVPLTAKIIRRRLKQAEFSIDIIGIDRPVRFGSEWPGDLLGMFPVFASALSGNEAVLGQYVVVDVERSLAVGAVGILGEVTSARSVEIGYGMNRSEYGRGYAAAAVGLLVRGLLERRALPTRIAEVTARTAVHNVASARVLEKNGFVRTGTDHNDEDGELVTWALQRDGGQSR